MALRQNVILQRQRSQRTTSPPLCTSCASAAPLVLHCGSSSQGISSSLFFPLPLSIIFSFWDRCAKEKSLMESPAGEETKTNTDWVFSFLFFLNVFNVFAAEEFWAELQFKLRRENGGSPPAPLPSHTFRFYFRFFSQSSWMQILPPSQAAQTRALCSLPSFLSPLVSVQQQCVAAVRKNQILPFFSETEPLQSGLWNTFYLLFEF